MLRKLAMAGSALSIVLLVATLYLGNRLHAGDPSVKNIHLVFAISGASLSVLVHALSLVVLFLTRPKS